SVRFAVEIRHALARIAREHFDAVIAEADGNPLAIEELPAARLDPAGGGSRGLRRSIGGVETRDADERGRSAQDCREADRTEVHIGNSGLSKAAIMPIAARPSAPCRVHGGCKTNGPGWAVDS